MKAETLSDKKKKKDDKYKIYCNVCKKITNFKVVLVSRKFGVKLKCLKCGKTIHKNNKYLQNKKK